MHFSNLKFPGFNWTEASNDGIGLKVTYDVGALRHNLVTTSLTEDNWNVVDSKFKVVRFLHTKEMGKEINRWVDSQIFSDKSRPFNAQSYISQLALVLFESKGKGSPPRNLQNISVRSLDPRRRRPQIKYERDLNQSPYGTYMHNFFFRYSKKETQSC